MKFKFLNIALVSVVLTVSSFANATLIKFTYESVSFDSVKNNIDSVQNNNDIDNPTFLTTDTISGTIIVRLDGELIEGTFYDTRDNLEIESYEFTAGQLVLTEAAGFSDGNFVFYFGNDAEYSFQRLSLTQGEYAAIGDVKTKLYIHETGTWSYAERRTCSGWKRDGVTCTALDRFVDPWVWRTDTLGIEGLGIGSWSATKVPEPSTLAIFALGMIGFASRRFKKQS